MRKTIGFALLGFASVACASLTPQGAAVKVYQADLKSEDAASPAMPQGCRLLGSGGPIQQEEQERRASDPYRAQRNAAASSGGNVLLVKSYRFMTLKGTECGESQAKDCASDSAQNWYRVSFGYYSCDSAAQAALAELKPAAEGGLFVWTLNRKESSAATPGASAPVPSGQPATAPAGATTTAPAPPENAAGLEAKVLTLVKEGVGDDVIAAYVRSHRPSPPLTAEEIIEWKKVGISDVVIRATFAN